MKFWRLQLLLLISHPKDHFELITFCNNLKKGGLYIIGNVKTGNLQEVLADYNQDRNAFIDFASKFKLKAFSSYVVAKTVRDGVQNILLVFQIISTYQL